MSYYDEPNVIRERSGGKKKLFLIGGIVLFLVLIAGAALTPYVRDYRKSQTPEGPNHGSLYFINLEGERFSLELARPRQPLQIFLEPTVRSGDWSPAEYHVAYSVDGFSRADGSDMAEVLHWDEATGSYALRWDEESESYLPSGIGFHPNDDFRLTLEIYRDGEPVWSGPRWTYGAPGGHAH